MRDIWSMNVYWAYDSGMWLRKKRLDVYTTGITSFDFEERPEIYSLNINLNISTTGSTEYYLNYMETQTYQATAEWGDASSTEIVNFSNGSFYLYHEYPIGTYESKISFPAGVASFYCNSNEITFLSNNFPDSITNINCSVNLLTKMPITLPRKLNYLDISQNSLNSTEVDNVLIYIQNTYDYFQYLDLRMTSIAPPSPSVLESFLSKHSNCNLFVD